MAPELPSGTVTFLFTDVEGSTKLLDEVGAEAYGRALADHRRILREGFARHGGVEVDMQGDAFFAAFSSARAAVDCAREAQEQLASTPLRVRMGLHSGEAIVDDGQYVGLDVHRAARVAAAGHGGQVLVSSTTAPLLDSERLRDLGEHRLKDLSTPLRLYQLGDLEFPPLKTLHRTNLPIPATPFLGRERELANVLALLRNAHRLLTLTGPGGTGKTRLALQAAAELADECPGGVFWVPLASLRDPSLITAALAHALGVEEEGGTAITESVAAAVTSPTLLLIDNCEHILDGVAASLAPILRTTASLRIIATSREPLALSDEHIVRVDPLERDDAVRLFLTRAEAAGATDIDAETAGTLCARLDDLPLAIELAAARTAAVPAELLLERLSSRLELLRGPRDAEERQRTLRATIAWSYDLLTPEEQHVLRRVSVFVGGATIETLEDVAQATSRTLHRSSRRALCVRRRHRAAPATGCWKRSESSRPGSSTTQSPSFCGGAMSSTSRVWHGLRALVSQAQMWSSGSNVLMRTSGTYEWPSPSRSLKTTTTPWHWEPHSVHCTPCAVATPRRTKRCARRSTAPAANSSWPKSIVCSASCASGRTTWPPRKPRTSPVSSASVRRRTGVQTGGGNGST